MPVTLARIDQRLIHGITVNQWYAALHPKRFMVVDDEISQNEPVKESMRMSKPIGTGLSIISESKAANNFRAGKYDDQDVFLIVREPAILLRLIEGGVGLPAVNLGVIFNENGRQPISDRVAVNDEERRDLVSIARQGIPVTLQYRPEDTKVSLEHALEHMIS